MNESVNSLRYSTSAWFALSGSETPAVQMNSLLNLFIGLALTFGCFSLMVSAIVEAVASALSWRSSTLVSGIKKLLNDPNLNNLAHGVLNHAAVNPLSDGKTQPGKAPSATPSYVAPDQFATALVDVVRKVGAVESQARAAAVSVQDLSASIDKISDPQIRTQLASLYEQAMGDESRFRHAIANWFDAAMDRLSGVYKRRTQLWSLVVAFLLAIALNLDAVYAAHILWVDPEILQKVGLAGTVDDYGKAYAAWSASFPFGWSLPRTGNIFASQRSSWAGTLTMPLGWALMAAATLFGAPFWFDTLQRFVQLRGTGPEPAGKPADATPGLAVLAPTLAAPRSALSIVPPTAGSRVSAAQGLQH